MTFEAGAGGFRVSLMREMPEGLDERRVQVDRVGSSTAGHGDEDGEAAYALVHRAGGAPTLLVIGSHRPGFICGIHIAVDSGVMFFGCGEAVCAYDMATGRKLHHDITPYGFHSWNRHNDVLVMSAELEVAVYALDGNRRWAATVEPPWDYGVNGDRMYTVVMGHRVEFPLHTGPADLKLVDR